MYLKVFPEGLMVDMASIFFQAEMCPTQLFQWKLIFTFNQNCFSYKVSNRLQLNSSLFFWKLFETVLHWHTFFQHLPHVERKRKRSDSVLWQKPLHQQKCQKGKVTTQTTPQKSSIKQRLRTDLGRSVGVTTATQLVWLTGLRAHLPTNRNSRLIKRTHV